MTPKRAIANLYSSKYYRGKKNILHTEIICKFYEIMENCKHIMQNINVTNYNDLFSRIVQVYTALQKEKSPKFLKL